MPATPVKIGPFAGGMNAYSGPTSIGDNEAVEIINFDIDLDGSLYSRSPITALDQMKSAPALQTGEVKVLGWYINTNDDRYMIVSVGTKTLARNEETGVWTQITALFGAVAVVQYQNKAYLVSHPDSGQSGGWWTPAVAFTAVAGIPKGTSVAVYKERLFVTGDKTSPNRVFFSNPANFEGWQPTINFFDVRAGDGQTIVSLFTFQDTIMCFKENSTYVFSYDSNPTRGTVRLVNGSIGLSNKHCVKEYENTLYIHYDNEIYQIANWNFTQVNLKMPFDYVVISDPALYEVNYPTISILSDRLVVKHYDRIYVFNLRVGAWSRWELGIVPRSALVLEDLNPYFNYFVSVPRRTASESERYYAGCRRLDGTKYNHAIFEWRPAVVAGRLESNMAIRLITKTYDMNVPYTFKRLFWWGVDLMAKSTIMYKMSPVAYSRSVTHAELSAYTHAQLAAGTHGRLLDLSLDVTDVSAVSNLGNNRMFVKLLKSSRFRQIYFTIEGIVNGDTADSPMRIYTVVAFIDNKQVVPKQLN